VPAQNVYRYISEGNFKQNQLIANGNVRIGSKVQLFGYYTLNYANSNTSGVSSFPTNSYDISQDYGRGAFDTRHRLFLGGSIGLPYLFRLSPFMIVSSRHAIQHHDSARPQRRRSIQQPPHSRLAGNLLHPLHHRSAEQHLLHEYGNLRRPRTNRNAVADKLGHRARALRHESAPHERHSASDRALKNRAEAMLVRAGLPEAVVIGEEAVDLAARYSAAEAQ
jgi:hypothetical protein